jgi:hypothetical protein
MIARRERGVFTLARACGHATEPVGGQHVVDGLDPLCAGLQNVSRLGVPSTACLDNQNGFLQGMFPH